MNVTCVALQGAEQITTPAEAGQGRETGRLSRTFIGLMQEDPPLN